jgi:hypothetical protein
MTAAIWDDGTVDAGEVASQLRAGLLAAGWKLAGGGQKMADAASFPYPLTIEVSSVRASEEDNSPDAAKALHAALERQHIASTIRLTEQPLPPNFLKIEVKGQ